MNDAKLVEDRLPQFLSNVKTQCDAARVNIQVAIEKLGHAATHVDLSKELNNLQQIQVHFEALPKHLTNPEAPLPEPPAKSRREPRAFQPKPTTRRKK